MDLKTTLTRLFLLNILLAATLSAGAIDMDYRVSARAGWILPDGKVEKVAPQRIVPMGGEVAIGFHPDWQALRDWNNASVGVALSYWYMGDRQLGHAIAPYAYMDIPFVRLPHWEFGIRPGIGCALMTSTFRNTIDVPFDEVQSLTTSGGNYCIGSVFNFYFPEALYMNFPIRKGWAITLAGGWYHISNGSTIQPNSGYNIFSGELGVSVSPNSLERAVVAKEDRTLPKNWEVDVAATGGFRQVYYKDKRTFGIATLEASAFWRAHRIFRLGGGVDVFYDGAYCGYPTSFGKTAQHLATPADCWRVGVSLQPEFVIGHFVAGFHVGAYLYDPVKNLEAENGSEDWNTLWTKKERLNKPLFYRYDILNAGSAGYPDGWLYTSIVLRYHLPYHLMIHAEMKAHLTKVEFVSIGAGAWL